jgi:hypothetical protein
MTIRKEEVEFWETVDIAAKEWAERHSFRVPYNGTTIFYDDTDATASIDGFKEGINWYRSIYLKEKLKNDRQHN